MKPKVLLVDDRPENLLALETILGNQGLELVRALSGEEALLKVLDDEFAVILLDVRMPDMDGFETATYIRTRERSRYTPIIFVTAGSRSEEYSFKGYQHGAVDYILKPIAADVLRAKVKVFVELYRHRDLLRGQAEELRRSNAELAQFAYVASHDLREPLRKIAGFAQLLSRQYAGRIDETADRYLQQIQVGVTRMQDLIKDLLDYSKAGRWERPLEDIHADAALDRALDALGPALADARAKIERCPLPRVRADLTQLSQVFQNLIANAIKFRGKEDPVVRVSARRAAEAWEFGVSDNGIGIAPQDQPGLFAVFHRLHTREQYPGTGIGLAICKKVVESHGGRIWVRSEPGRGATFFFSLPSPAAVPDPAAGSKSPGLSGRG